MIDRDQFGPLLRLLRVSSNLTVKELAERAGTSPSTVSRFERGARDVSLDVAARMFGVFGIPLTLDLDANRVVEMLLATERKRKNWGVVEKT